MGSPYLNSGERIVLTTSRITAEAVSYDVMLTNERIFFIDNRMVRLEPRIIPLSALLSVQGGKTPAQDPVITLMFRERKGREPRQPLNLVFSQAANENRRPERDDWVRSLIQLSINQQERYTVAEPAAMPQTTREPGLRPSTRHGVAPDRVRPLSNVTDRSKIPAPLTITPEEIPGSGDIPLLEDDALPEGEESAVPDSAEDIPAVSTIPVREEPPAAMVPAGRVIIPQIIEELLPLKQTPVVGDVRDAGTAAVIDQEALFRTIPRSASRSMTIVEERTPLPHPAQETVPVPGECVPGPVAPEQKEVPEIIRALHIGALKPVSAEPDGMAAPLTGMEPVPEMQEPDPEMPVTPRDTPKPVPEMQEPDPEMPVTPRDTPEPVPEMQEPDPEMPVTPRDTPEPVPEILEPDPEMPVTPRDTPEPVPEMQEPDPEMPVTPRDSHSADIPQFSQPHISPDLSETGAQEPKDASVPDETPRREHAVCEGQPARHPIPPACEIRPLKTTLTYIAVALIIVVLMVAGVVLVFMQQPGMATGQVTPVLTPVQVTPVHPVTTVPVTTHPIDIPVTIPEITPGQSSPAPAVVPLDGIWVRLNSTSNYSGTVGNAGMLRAVNATGDNFYRIFWSDHPIQVSVTKNDYSGAPLTAAVYRNGTLITLRSITAPRGTVEILIDPRTARAPGLTENDTAPEYAYLSTGRAGY